MACTCALTDATLLTHSCGEHTGARPDERRRGDPRALVRRAGADRARANCSLRERMGSAAALGQPARARRHVGGRDHERPGPRDPDRAPGEEPPRCARSLVWVTRGFSFSRFLSEQRFLARSLFLASARIQMPFLCRTSSTQSLSQEFSSRVPVARRQHSARARPADKAGNPVSVRE